jgi:hypothetical protein
MSVEMPTGRSDLLPLFDGQPYGAKELIPAGDHVFWIRPDHVQDEQIIFFRTHNPGPTRTVSSLIGSLVAEGYSVVCSVSGDIPERILSEAFPQSAYTGDAALIPFPNIMLFSGDQTADETVLEAEIFRSYDLNGPLIGIEDYPNSIRGIMDGLVARGIAPSALCTTTQTQTEFYAHQYAGFVPSTHIMEIGNPAFLRPYAEQEITEEELSRIRTECGIEEDDRVVVLVGRPGNDQSVLLTSEAVSDPRTIGITDANSLMLYEVFDALENIPPPKKGKTVVVYIPHPRDPYDHEHPLLIQWKGRVAPQIHIVNHSVAKLQEMAPSAFAAWNRIATLIISISSTELDASAIDAAVHTINSSSPSTRHAIPISMVDIHDMTKYGAYPLVVQRNAVLHRGESSFIELLTWALDPDQYGAVIAHLTPGMFQVAADYGTIQFDQSGKAIRNPRTSVDRFLDAWKAIIGSNTV